MTLQQRNAILALRESGTSMRKIAETLGLPLNTVKSFCYRSKTTQKETEHLICCNYCGSIIKQKSNSTVRHFCDRHCYIKWWHCQSGRSRTVYHKECLYCGKLFDALSKKTQRYCSIACFQASRKAGGPVG